MFYAPLLLALTAAGCGGTGPSDDGAFQRAIDAMAAGQKQEAIGHLTSALEQQPAAYTHYLRAKLYLETNNDQAAKADIESGLRIEPENRDLNWLLAESKKPAPQRFQGTNSQPPSFSK